MLFHKVKEGEVEQRFVLLAEGEAEFKVIESEQLISKSGNEMIKLTLNCKDCKENHGTVYDYLVGTEKMKWKIKHFFESVGMEKEYETCEEILPEQLIGKSGKAILKTQQQPGYDPKTSVKEYIKSDEIKQEIPDLMPDDDIPF